MCRTPELSAIPANMINMNAFSLLVTLLIGVALGAAIGYLLARGKLANLAADLTGRARAADERADAAQSRAALIERSHGPRKRVSDSLPT